jgi:hypothetical protein
MKVEITIPDSIAEIPLVNYQKFLKLQENSDDQEFIAQKMIEIFCGIDLKDVAKIKYNDMNNLVEHFNKIFSVKPVFYQRFKLKEMEFGFIPNLEEISWGEYIDLEHHMNSWEDFHKAMAVMYRPITKSSKDKYEIAPYTASEEFHELMKYMPMEIAISARVFFLQFRQRVIKFYPVLFGNPDDQDEEQKGEEDFSERGQFAKQWGWYSSIYAVAKGDISKFDEVTAYGLHKCLTYLTFEKQKNEIEQREINKRIKK